MPVSIYVADDAANIAAAVGAAVAIVATLAVTFCAATARSAADQCDDKLGAALLDRRGWRRRRLGHVGALLLPPLSLRRPRWIYKDANGRTDTQTAAAATRTAAITGRVVSAKTCKKIY